MNKHQQEFIGKHAKVTKAANKQLQGIEGKIVDETKNTFTIKTQTKELKILKKGNEFQINNQKINGEKITRRPEERIKIKEK